MGFECGFRVVPRIDHISAIKYLYTEAELYYEKLKNSVKQFDITYPTFEEYFKADYSWANNKAECFYPENAETMDLYRNIKPAIVNFWCSIGKRLDDVYMQDKLKEIKPFEEYEVTKEWIESTLKQVTEDLKIEKLIPSTILYSFQYNEDGDKVLKPCDGVLTEDEDGHQALIDLEFDNIWVAPHDYDPDYHTAKKSFKETLEDLRNIDLDDNIVLYYRSY